jgi:N-carbamoylputrescine amidase
MPNKFTIGLVQMRCTTNADENLSRAVDKIREAAARGAQIISLHELFRSEYFCRKEDPALFDLAEPVPGPATDKLAQIAKERKIALVVSLFERRAAGVYHNTCAVIDADGRFLGKYRKMHIPDDPAYYEKFYFTPGDLGFEPCQTSVGKLGVLVCWDQWYPEAARLMALAGADMLLYPTAIGWDPSDDDAEKSRQREAWITVQRGHAVANGLPLLACNRTGFEASPDGGKGIQFWGSSFVAGPQGEFIAQASTDKREMLIVDVDLARSEAVRRIWPFLRDRRIDAYQDLLKRYRD